MKKERGRTMFCQQCGSQLNPNSKFCMKCGAKIERVGATHQPGKTSDDNKKELYALYSKTYKQVFARASFMFRGEQDIDEVVRQVYCSTYNNLDKMNTEENLQIWLRSVTYLHGTKVFQQKGTKSFLVQEKDELVEIFTDKQVDNNFEGTQDIENIKRHIHGFPNELRTVMLAFYYDRLSEEKIAEALSISERVVRGRLFAAQNELKQCLEAQGIDVSKINKSTISLAVGALMKQYMNVSAERIERVLDSVCKALGWSIGNLVASQGQVERRESAKVIAPVSKPKKKNLYSTVAIVILSIFIFVGVVWIVADQMGYSVWDIFAGESNDDDDDDYRKKYDNEEDEKDEDDEQQVEQEKDSEEEEEQNNVPVEEEEQEQEQDTTVQNSEYIFPNSGTQYLTEYEVASLPAELLPFARNEIIARRGRIFTNEVYKTYFESKSWYRGVIQPEDFDSNYEGNLSVIEKANIELIKKYEEIHAQNQ